MAHLAMENGPFIDGLPIKNADFPWLCSDGVYIYIYLYNYRNRLNNILCSLTAMRKKKNIIYYV